jgi:hypothetical protein
LLRELEGNTPLGRRGNNTLELQFYIPKFQRFLHVIFNLNDSKSITSELTYPHLRFSSVPIHFLKGNLKWGFQCITVEFRGI